MISDTLLAALPLRAKILAAYEAARAEGYTATDDAALYRRHFGEINFTSGSPRNQKLTTPEDLAMGEALLEWRDTP